MASSSGPVNEFSCEDENRGDFCKRVEQFYVTLQHSMSSIYQHAVVRTLHFSFKEINKERF